MNKKIIISSMAMDLKRAALGYYNGSNKTADRFVEEALKRKEEVSGTAQKNLKNLLDKITQSLKQNNKKNLAEDLLMYSTQLQNYTLKFLK